MTYKKLHTDYNQKKLWDFGVSLKTLWKITKDQTTLPILQEKKKGGHFTTLHDFSLVAWKFYS